MSRLSKKHVKITPDECNNCRLCEESCPFGAIEKPVETDPAEKKETGVKRIALLFILLPVIVLSSGWIGSRLHIPLSKLHPTVSLAENILQEDSGQKTETSDHTLAFRASGKPRAELFEEAVAVQRKFKTGGWILGGFIGLIICLKLISLSIQRRRPEYAIDKGNCFSCGRCFLYCPFEQVRLGLISPEELDQIKPGINL
jgi:ferredoxin